MNVYIVRNKLSSFAKQQLAVIDFKPGENKWMRLEKETYLKHGFIKSFMFYSQSVNEWCGNPDYFKSFSHTEALYLSIKVQPHKCLHPLVPL